MADKKISQLTNATTPLAGTETLPIVQSGNTVKVSIENVLKSVQPTGSANAVVYLNNSQIATTGSALTFDGSAFTLTSGGRIRNIPATTTDFAQFQAQNGGNAMYTGVEDSTGSLFTGVPYAGLLWQTGNRILAVGVNNTEVARWDTSGNYKINNGNLVQGTAAKGVNFTANTPAAGMTSQLLNWYEEGTWTPAYSATGLSGVTYLIQQGTYTRIGRAVYIVFYIATSGTFTSGSSTVTITGLPFTSASTNTSHVGFANATRWATAPVSGRISSSTTSINIYSAFNGTGPGTDPVAITGSGMTSGDGGNNNIIQASAMYFV